MRRLKGRNDTDHSHQAEVCILRIAVDDNQACLLLGNIASAFGRRDHGDTKDCNASQKHNERHKYQGALACRPLERPAFLFWSVDLIGGRRAFCRGRSGRGSHYNLSIRESRHCRKCCFVRSHRWFVSTEDKRASAVESRRSKRVIAVLCKNEDVVIKLNQSEFRDELRDFEMFKKEISKRGDTEHGLSNLYVYKVK